MSLKLLNNESLVFLNAAPKSVSDYVNIYVGSHEIFVSKYSRSTASVRHRRAGGIDFCQLIYGTEARIVSKGLNGVYHIQFILSGDCRYTFGSEKIRLSSGSFAPLNPQEPIDLTYSEDCEKFIISIPASHFTETCIEHHWKSPRSNIRFDFNSYKFDDTNNLFSVLKFVCSEIESGAATPPQLRHYSRIITGKLLLLLKSNIETRQNSESSVVFNTLVKHIDENIKQDISIDELATKSRLSQRSLYTLFKTNTGTTPKVFVRQRKLEAIHEILTNSCFATSGIIALASEYGFTHPGRFAHLYKKTFGVLPSKSLRKRRNGT